MMTSNRTRKMKKFSKCKELKPLKGFLNKSWCFECRNSYKRDQLCKDYRAYMLARSKFRASQLGLPFDLVKNDIPLITHCPVFGFKLEPGNGVVSPKSPSLDRIISELGYVKGNVIVVSNKANLIKSSASPEEIMKVAKFYKKIIKK